MVKDVREQFTLQGGSPHAMQVLVEDEGGTVPPRWVMLWEFWGFPDRPKKSREPVDDALKKVLFVLKSYKSALKRTNSRIRGGRHLEPKSLSAVISYEDVVRRLTSSPEFQAAKKWGNKIQFTTEVQTSETGFQTLYIEVFQGYGSGNLGWIEIYPFGG